MTVPSRSRRHIGRAGDDRVILGMYAAGRVRNRLGADDGGAAAGGR
jgi:hypothetical protein